METLGMKVHGGDADVTSRSSAAMLGRLME